MLTSPNNTFGDFSTILDYQASSTNDDLWKIYVDISEPISVSTINLEGNISFIQYVLKDTLAK